MKPCQMAWMNLQGIRLSETSQRKADTTQFYLHVDSKK